MVFRSVKIGVRVRIRGFHETSALKYEIMLQTYIDCETRERIA